MKVGIVFFHKKITSIYKDRWVKKCVNSMLNQTYKKSFIYEVNYGNDDYSIITESDIENNKFYKEDFKNYAEAMNFIITKAFEDDCDYVFNVNLDDFYDETRIEKQLQILKKGYDIVSSDFCHIQEFNDEDKITRHMKMCSYGDIKENLLRNHNVIAHPSIGINKSFWVSNKYDTTKIPQEDLDLWKKSIQNGFKFYIIDEELLFYRIHIEQVSNKKN